MLDRDIITINEKLADKIDRYRGSLRRSEFINECVETMVAELEPKLRAPLPKRSYLRDEREEEETPEAEYITRREFDRFKREMYKSQEMYLDFFVRYGELLLEGPLPREKAEEFHEELRRLLRQ